MTTDPYALARTAVLDARAALVALSRDIFAHPELNFAEHYSSARVADELERHGFTVERGAYDIETAFEARCGSGELVVAICAEYDALPSVGHACGHNVIAAAAVGAALALAGVADEAGLSVVVLGTPAEEGGGGKILMAERGAFDGVHCSMMVHPWATERLEATCLAVDHFDVTFTGFEAHASAAPWKGRNAADAMVIAQVALGLLRQQLQPGDQLHGIVTNGGAAANVIPAKVTGRFMCRSLRLEDLTELQRRVRNCFTAAALATDCEVSFTDLAPIYSHMESDQRLLASYRRHAETLGRSFDLDDEGVAKPTLSTDMANVSLLVPSIHPMIKIDAGGAVNHQHECAAACITESADLAITDGAIAMALTALDAALDDAWRSDLLALGS